MQGLKPLLLILWCSIAIISVLTTSVELAVGIPLFHGNTRFIAIASTAALILWAFGIIIDSEVRKLVALFRWSQRAQTRRKGR